MPQLRDLRFSWRLLRRSPAFTAVALLSLALGIGANTAIFSLIDALLVRSLPVKRPPELLLFGEGQDSGASNSFPGGNPEWFSQPFYRLARANNRVFTDLAAIESMRGDGHARLADGTMEPLAIRLVSGNYFSVLGVGAAAGRVLTPQDDQAPGVHPVAVMSHAFWKRHFARAPAAIGSTFTLNGTVFTIVGVAAPEFFGTNVGESTDFWIPLAMQAQVQPWLRNPLDPQEQTLWLIGRRKPGIITEAAQANINVLFQQWLHELAGPVPAPAIVQAMRTARIDLTDASRGLSALRWRFSRPLEILFVLVGLVLLVACANLANLLLARAAGRRREMAIRLALGAERRRLIAQLLSESVLLALLGGALGVLFAWWGGRVLLAMVAGSASLDVGPNGRLLLFTSAVSLATGILFGIAPALRATRVDAGPSLKSGKGAQCVEPRNRLGQLLVATEVALVMVLVIGAGLFLRTLRNLQQEDAGFDRHRVVLVRFDTGSAEFRAPAVLGFSQRIEARVRALPGVEAASFAMMTFHEGRWSASVWPEGIERTETNGRTADGNRVGKQYFETLGMPLLMGRTFGPRDTPQSQPVAVVNETLAHTVFPDTSPLGRRLWLAGESVVEIVGVVRDARQRSLREKPGPAFYLFNEQAIDGFDDLIVRVAGGPDALMSQIRAAIRADAPNLAITEVGTLDAWVDRTLIQEKLLARLSGFFGALALLLASIGLYGVVAYSVSRRTGEIGIRMALGAEPGHVLRMVMRDSLVAVVLGLTAGIPMALASSRLVASRLYGLRADDPWTSAGAAAVLLSVALIAAFLPARRAARLDPLSALREE
jgi:predicted permease